MSEEHFKNGSFQNIITPITYITYIEYIAYITYITYSYTFSLEVVFKTRGFQHLTEICFLLVTSSDLWKRQCKKP